MSVLPRPEDLARLLPSALAEAGGSVDRTELQRIAARVDQRSGSSDDDGRAHEYIKTSINQALQICERMGLVRMDENHVQLTDVGWVRYYNARAGEPAAPVMPSDELERASQEVGQRVSPSPRPEREPVERLHAAIWGASRGRKPGRTWERLVCEVLGDLGGHADWPSIGEAVERQPEAATMIDWRERTMQTLRKHTSPSGRSYFEKSDAGGRLVYVLAENGRTLAGRRILDDRAPTLSKLIGKAASPDFDGKLTEYELFALLFLATRLGKPAEAHAIFSRLPEGFPDDDSYHMSRYWIQQAEERAQEGA